MTKPYRAKAGRSRESEEPLWETDPLLFLVAVLAGDDLGCVRQHFSVVQFASWTDPGVGYPIDASHYHSRAIELTTAAMIDSMRYLADLWIDSGKKRCHDETLNDTPGDRRTTFTDAQRWRSISLLYDGFIGKGNGVSFPAMHEDGKQFIQMAPLGFQPLFRGNTPTMEKELKAFGEQIAIYRFSQFLNSSKSGLLNRCDECMKYIAYERLPRNGTILGGVNCSDLCRKEAGRRRHRTVLLLVAARAWRKWKHSARWPDQEEYVLETVNRDLDQQGKDRKKKNWVSLHLDEIKKRANEIL